MKGISPIRNNKAYKPGQSGNPGGRPKRRYKEHLEELSAKGYVPPLREEYHKMIGMILAMTESDLVEFAKDKEKPYWIRLIIADLNDKKVRQKLMADYRDWLYGKAKQEFEGSFGISDDFKSALEMAKKALGDVAGD